MSALLEYRKIKDINVPLYFKFNTLPTKNNNLTITTDKLITLENWFTIFEELNPLLQSDPSSSKKSKTFDIDSGRLCFRAKWVKINDSSEVGTHIIKILNLSSSNSGKYFLKIDVTLSSYLERFATELERKNKSLDVKNKTKESNQDSHNSSKHKKMNHRKISDMLPKIEKDKQESPLLFNDTVPLNEFEELAADDLYSVEEYIPEPAPSASSTFLAESTPIYTPEKSCSQTDMNPIHSEYSPISLKGENPTDELVKYEPTALTPPTATNNPEKKLSQTEMNKITPEYSPTYNMNDKSKIDESAYKPTARESKSSDIVKTKTILKKELFGSSDESYDDDRDTPEKVSSSSHKSKRKLDSSPKREKKSSKERSKSKKKKFHDVQSSQDSSDAGDISIRNLMNEPINDILATYPEHEIFLADLYKRHIKQMKMNYRSVDIPQLAALDILSTKQFGSMVEFLERKLVRNAEEEHTYSDIMFDSLVPEWALAIFCKKFDCSRTDAIERLRLQTIAMSNRSLQL